MTAAARDLHLLATAAWPAREQVERGGWLLRASAGVTRRANSALPLTEDAAPLALLLPEVEDFYDARLLPPCVQVDDPALDRELAARGWTASGAAELRAGPLPDGPSDAQVGGPDDAWVAAWWRLDPRGGPAERDVAATMLRSVRPPQACARVVRDGAVVGVARAVAQQAWLGVFGVVVDPSWRRRGVASALLSTLWRWGDGHGTTTAYLQVERGSDATPLYRAMPVVGTYGYRTRPLPSGR